MTDLTGLTIILTIMIIMIWSLKVLNDAREHVKLFLWYAIIIYITIIIQYVTFIYAHWKVDVYRYFDRTKYVLWTKIQNKWLKRQNSYKNRRDNLQLEKMVIRTKFGTKLLYVDE